MSIKFSHTLRHILRKDNLALGLFVLVYLVFLGLKFWGLISLSEILPGGDTLGHFVTLKEVIANLAAGRWFAPAYNIYWFGGEPLLQFYAPLNFMIMGAVAFLSRGTLSLFLIYRWFIFFSFAIFPLAFYFFLKEFFGKEVAKWGIWFSLLWVFYPKAQSDLGIGASGAIALGLFSEAIAVSVALAYLTFFQRLLTRRHFDAWTAVWAGLFLGLLILTHTLTFIGILIISGLLLLVRLFQEKRPGLFLNLSLLAVVALALSAFWFWPFLHNLSYTSAERIDVKAFLDSPLIPFLNFNFLAAPSSWLTQPYATLLVFLFFLAGLVYLLRAKHYELPFIFFAYFAITGLDYVNSQIFTTLTLHYYRLLALDFPIFLSIAAYGFLALGQELKGKKFWRPLLLGLSALFLLHYLYFYQFGTDPSQATTGLSVSQVIDTTPYYFQLPQFKKFGAANAAVSVFRRQLTAAPTRIMPDMDPLSMYNNLGSIHFFNTALPLANNQSSLFGLYAESSWQVPFIFPTTNLLTGNNMIWGRVRDLAFNDYFNKQDAAAMVKRLQLFGVDYLLTASKFFDDQVQKIPQASLVNELDIYRIYHLAGSRPLVYPAAHQPGLYVNGGGSDFREFALGWYSVPDLLDKPIAEWPKSATELDQAAVAPFSFLVVAVPANSDKSLVQKLENFGKPLLIVHAGTSTVSLTDPQRGIYEINGFRPVAGYYGSSDFVQPDITGLNSLRDFVLKYAAPNGLASSTPAISVWTDNRLSFSGSGPVIINLGYFPYWQAASGATVFPVTPGQMLVFVKGTTTLNYVPGTDYQVGKIISLAAVGVILVYLAYGLITKNKKKNNL